MNGTSRDEFGIILGVRCWTTEPGTDGTKRNSVELNGLPNEDEVKLLKHIINVLKGAVHANDTRESSSRGDGNDGRVFHPFTSVRERAFSDLRGIRMLEEALTNERSRDIGGEPSDPVLRESGCLIAAAKIANCLLEAKSVPGTRYSVRTGESEVRMVQREQMYYKIKNPFAKSHLKRHDIREVIYEHVIHNILFPETALQFLGVCEDGREARLIYSQKAVRTERRPTDEQIEKYLASLGLEREGRYEFGNEFLFVTDVGQDGDNVLLGDDDKLYFIDPIIGFKVPALELIDKLI